MRINSTPTEDVHEPFAVVAAARPTGVPFRSNQQLMTYVGCNDLEYYKTTHEITRIICAIYINVLKK